MPPSPTSPDPSPASPPPDTVASALEYIPATSPPPPLPSSESMRRLRDLLSANKLSPNSQLSFSYNSKTFYANLTPDGTLCSPAPRPENARLSSTVCKVYASPSEFASEMALLSLTSDPKGVRPRGRIAVNGWDECYVNGRSLASLRSEMLREKKPLVLQREVSHALPTANDSKHMETNLDNYQLNKGHTSTDQGKDHNHVRGEHVNMSDDKKQVAKVDIEKETDHVSATQSPVKPSAELNRAVIQEIPACNPTSNPPARHPEIDDPKPACESVVPEKDQQSNKAAAVSVSVSAVEMHIESNNVAVISVPAEEKDKESNKGIAISVLAEEKGNDSNKAAAASVSAHENLDGVDKMDVEGKLNNLDDAAVKNVEMKPVQHYTGKDVKIDETEDRVAVERPRDVECKSGNGDVHDNKVVGVGGQESVLSVAEPKTQSKNNSPTDTKPTTKLDAKVTEQETKRHDKSHVTATDKGMEADKLNVDVPTKDVSPKPSKQDILEDKKEMPADEKQTSSSPSKMTKKRKRSESNESSPGGASTPSRRSQERSLRSRPDWNRGIRKVDIPSASGMDTEGLDPESIEAAAVAAQAEKEEANSRARRTTRLAAGKIKQVDYKAVGNAQVSPGRDDEDAENVHSNDSNTEPARNSRRRTGQNQSMVPQRSSRRVARMRGSQDKEQSSNEEQDHSPPGHGSDGRGDADMGSQNDLLAEPTTVSRMNGSRSEGRERKRIRTESRKSRHLQTEPAEYDGEDRAYYGTRSSTRENSVVDPDDGDSGHHSDEIDVEEDGEWDEDPDKRVDEHGWNIQELIRIGEAIDSTESIEQEEINGELYRAGKWKSDEATNKRVASYIDGAVSFISEMKKGLCPDKEEKVTISELCTFIGMDIWRLKTGGLPIGCPRKPTRILAKAEKEEKRKASLDKSRRRYQRETDELRGKLDCELEIRRKAELDVAYVEVQLNEKAQMLPREEAQQRELEKRIDYYKMLESRTRSELDKTKILVSQLRGERESPDHIATVQKNPAPPHSSSMKPVEVENGDLPKEAMRTLGESVTSAEDVEISHKEEASPSQRYAEMERLRGLIATKEAEAEASQRDSEKERLKFMNIIDAKNRLEYDLYVNKSSGLSGHGGSASGTSGNSHHKSSKDASRKGDNRNGTTGANRSSGHSRGKSSNGKQALGVNPVIAKPKPSTSNNGKPIPGKNGEHSKTLKKKTVSKPLHAQAEKQ